MISLNPAEQSTPLLQKKTQRCPTLCPLSMRSIIGMVAGVGIAYGAYASSCWAPPIGSSVGFIIGQYFQLKPKSTYPFSGPLATSAFTTFVAAIGGAFIHLNDLKYALLTASLASALWSSSLTAGFLSNRTISLRETGKTALIAALTTALFVTTFSIRGKWAPIQCQADVISGLGLAIIAFSARFFHSEKGNYEGDFVYMPDL